MKHFELRPACEVMKLSHLGCLHPTRLSFARRMIRKLQHYKPSIQQHTFSLDENGFGYAVYTIDIDKHYYSLIAFVSQIDDEERTDRVIAEKWDTTFTLYDGIPTDNDIKRLETNVTLQEKGRYTEKELILSRANKSLRVFYHVIERLSQGQQPDRDIIQNIGYLLRTTAVYGNGKFGIADRNYTKDRAFFHAPFQLELLTVWLIRHFSFKLVEHIAFSKNPSQFVPLSPDTKRFLGIGNSTGLGMAPFLINHPLLLNNWIMAKEKALLIIRQQNNTTDTKYTEFCFLLSKAQQHIAQWNVDDERQKRRIHTLKDEIADLTQKIVTLSPKQPYFWNTIYEKTLDSSQECQELVIALLFEIHPELIDDLTEEMGHDIQTDFDASMDIGTLKTLIEKHYSFALHINFCKKENIQYFWYVSEEKLEPRLGRRYVDQGKDLELPLDIARQVNDLYSDLCHEKHTQEPIVYFLQKFPQYRAVIERVQNMHRYPYAEIHENIIGHNCVPLDMLRAKLSFFGASKFDPKSNKWTRVVLFQGAPLVDDIHTYNEKNSFLAVL